MNQLVTTIFKIQNQINQSHFLNKILKQIADQLPGKQFL